MVYVTATRLSDWSGTSSNRVDSPAAVTCLQRWWSWSGCNSSAVAPVQLVRWPHPARRGWRRLWPSISWHSWQVLPSFPSGSSILSLPHSQVRFRISSARSSSRFRLLSGLAVLVDQISVPFGESGVGG